MNIPVRFKLGKQSSLAPDGHLADFEDLLSEHEAAMDGIDPGVRLMYSANEGDLEGINLLLDSGVDVNFHDIDNRTALHIAVCQGFSDVVHLLLERGAQVDSKDRWGSTVAPMLVKYAREVPDYEIDPKELDFTNSENITKGTFRVTSWRGTKVAVKELGEDLFTDEEKVRAFRDELALLQKIRHPNVVQFLGAVTQSCPMMIITEYLQKGDLGAFFKRRGAIKAMTVVRLALDIARGMNYLHENSHHQLFIIILSLHFRNLLRGDTGHLKVADFGVSKLLTVKEDRPSTCPVTSRPYDAAEVFKNEEYDTKVDIFSFGLILQEMIEGCPPFSDKPEGEVPKLYAAGERPPFRAPHKRYVNELKELIEECWNEKPSERPPFRQIITQLEFIYNRFGHNRRWKFY